MYLSNGPQNLQYQRLMKKKVSIESTIYVTALVVYYDNTRQVIEEDWNQVPNCQ